MLKTITATAFSTVLAASLSIGAVTATNAATFNIAPVSVDSVVEKAGVRLSGAERLRRLMRPHFRDSNPITQSVRDATGDPNISVLDFRTGDPYQTYTCSFFNLRKNKRVLKCD